MTITAQKLTGVDLDAARMVALEALSLAVSDIEAGSSGEREYDRITKVLEQAWLVNELGTPATSPHDVMFDFCERDRATLVAAAVWVVEDLTYSLEPGAEGADERERRIRPTITAAERVQALADLGRV